MTKKKIFSVMSASVLMTMAMTATSFAAGWTNNNGTWKYLDKNGSAVSNEWKREGDFLFYLGDDGEMVKDALIEDGDDRYYVNNDGAMVKNTWRAIAADDDTDVEYNWYYFGADGKAYRNKDEKISASDVKTIGGAKYTFDKDGKMLYGFVTADTGDHYNADDEEWATTDAQYYFGDWKDGQAKTGWHEVTVNTDSIKDDDDKDKDTFWFYADENGKLVKNKKKIINGKTYYFDEYGRMITDWAQQPATGSTVTTVKDADGDIMYTDGTGDVRKNAWVRAVPEKGYDEDDYNDDKESWFYAENSGKVVRNKTKKINGKTYAFDAKGRMLDGIVFDDGDTLTNKANKDDKFTELTKDDYMTQAAATGADIYFFSNDEETDGSRKTGYQNVEFDDDTYQMYFNTTSGKAEDGYVKKIKKYASYGVVLKADNDESNYAAVQVASAEDYKTLAADDVSYNTSEFTNDTYVLVNTTGTVMTNKKNLKDSNDVYYFTDKNGVILYAGDKTYTSKSDDHNVEIEIGGKKYYVEK